MFANMVKGTEWEELASFVTPAMARVIDPRQLTGQVSVLARNLILRRGFAEAIGDVSGALTGAGLPIELSGARAQREGPSAHPRQSELVLSAYFVQIVACDHAILDFRRRSFAADGELLQWQPKPLYVRWQPSFVEGLRDLYAGYYAPSEDQFRAALARLGLEPARQALVEHFGAASGDMHFSLAAFRKSMSAVFRALAEAKSSVSPDFFTFGLGLLCLYEHLESLGEALDARAIYLRSAAAARGLSS